MKKLDGFMHGINLGGWLSQCTHTREHYDSFITEADIQRIAGWGLDHVRLPVDYELIETEDGSPIEAGYQYIETCIGWCKTHGLNMILDLHKTAGYVFDDQEASKGFFDKPELLERFIRLWITIAKRFVKDKDILIFELLNEIVEPDVSAQWNQLLARTVAAIREIDADVRIMYGGVCYNSVTNVKYLEPPKDDHIIFTFHCYEPLIFTHQGAGWTEGMPLDYRTAYPESLQTYIAETRKYLTQMMADNYGDTIDIDQQCSKEFFLGLFREAVDAAERCQVPLYCGEYGVIDRAEPQSTLRWYHDIHDAFEAYGIGRAAWSYKQMDFGLIDEHYDPVRDKITALL